MCLYNFGVNLSVGLVWAWTGVLAFDTMIFCLTVYKVMMYRSAAHGPLLEVLLRDGEVFILLVMAPSGHPNTL